MATFSASDEEIAELERQFGTGLSVKLNQDLDVISRIGKDGDSVKWSVVLPLPPSTNTMYVNVPGRGRVPSKKYREWKKQAAQSLKRMPKVLVPVEVRIIIRPGKFWRRNSDIANREKAVTDALVTAGIIPQDDCLCVSRLVMEYRPIPEPGKGIPPVVIVMVKSCSIASQPLGSLEDDP